MYKAP